MARICGKTSLFHHGCVFQQAASTARMQGPKRHCMPCNSMFFSSFGSGAILANLTNAVATTRRKRRENPTLSTHGGTCRYLHSTSRAPRGRRRPAPAPALHLCVELSFEIEEATWFSSLCNPCGDHNIDESLVSFSVLACVMGWSLTSVSCDRIRYNPIRRTIDHDFAEVVFRGRSVRITL